MTSSTPEQRRLDRKARRQEARREALLGAARELLVRGGIESLTMAAVADAADVSKPAVYYYFRSKEELVAGVASQLFDREVRAMSAAVERAETGVGALEALVRARVELYRDDPDSFRILYVWSQGFSLDPGDVADQVYRQSGTLNDRLEARLEADRHAGQLRADTHSRRLANLAWITAHGLLLFHTNLSTTRSSPLFSLDELTDEACRALRLAAASEASRAQRTTAPSSAMEDDAV